MFWASAVKRVSVVSAMSAVMILFIVVDFLLGYLFTVASIFAIIQRYNSSGSVAL